MCYGTYGTNGSKYVLVAGSMRLDIGRHGIPIGMLAEVAMPVFPQGRLRAVSTSTINSIVVVFGQLAYKKLCFNIAQYPVRWTAQSASHFLPSLTDLFILAPTRLLLETF